MIRASARKVTRKALDACAKTIDGGPAVATTARSLAEQAAAYAIEVERLYRNGGAAGRAA